MTITPKQAADRMKGIGSSDAAAVMGLSPFMTKHDLWMVKSGRSQGFSGNAATKRGDFLEAAIREMVAEELGEKVVACPGPFVKGILRANLDGQVGKYGRGNPVVECKSSVWSDGWGEPGTNEIPAHVLVQVVHQMHCAESDICYVAKLDRNMWPDIYVVEYDRDLAEMIVQACNRFWSEHVQADVPPEITDPSKDTLDALIGIERRKGSSVSVDPALCAALIDAKDRLAVATAEAKVARAQLLQAVGDHESFNAAGFKCSVSHVSGRKSFDSDRFKAERPELFSEYEKQGSGHHRLNVKREDEK